MDNLKQPYQVLAKVNIDFSKSYNDERNKHIIADEDKLFTTICIEFSGSNCSENELDLKVGDALVFPKNLTLIECAEIEKSEFIYKKWGITDEMNSLKKMTYTK